MTTATPTPPIILYRKYGGLGSCWIWYPDSCVNPVARAAVIKDLRNKSHRTSSALIDGTWEPSEDYSGYSDWEADLSDNSHEHDFSDDLTDDGPYVPYAQRPFRLRDIPAEQLGRAIPLGEAFAMIKISY